MKKSGKSQTWLWNTLLNFFCCYNITVTLPFKLHGLILRSWFLAFLYIYQKIKWDRHAAYFSTFTSECIVIIVIVIIATGVITLSCYIVHADLKLKIAWPQPLEGWFWDIAVGHYAWMASALDFVKEGEKTILCVQTCHQLHLQQFSESFKNISLVLLLRASPSKFTQFTSLFSRKVPKIHRSVKNT